MTAPFQDREGWEMTALALDGSVYIELHDPPEIRSKRSAAHIAFSREVTRV